MPSLPRRVADTIRRRTLLGTSDRVAMAVSGGADSVALAWLLHDLARRADWDLAGLVHVNHCLRGSASDADEAFCAELATRVGCPFDVSRVDVAAHARTRRVSIEVAAREARYACFDEATARLGATVVATGHTLDDQAETVMLRLLQGAGTRGLSGIRPRRGRYVRPLIDCRRTELVAWLAERGEAFRADATNDDVSIPRNRLRRDLMPVLEQIAPGGIRALARLADLAADDEAALEAAAIEILPSVVLTGGQGFADHDGGRGDGGRGFSPGVHLDAGRLQRLPAAIGRRIVREALARAAPGARITAGHLEGVRRLAAADKTAGRLHLPDVRVSRHGSRLVLEPAGSERRRPVEPFARVLEVPGSVDVPEAGVTIDAALASKMQDGMLTAQGPIVALQASAVSPPLLVRSRHPGDRLRPMGAPGRRKVQDILVDRKIPREARDRVPIVVDAGGRIVWVAGVTVAHECRVTAPETGVVILELKNSR